MNGINIYMAVWILTLVIFVNQVQSSGLFELRLKYFNNDKGIDNVGECCSGQREASTGKCIGTCKTWFRVCLKHYQATIDTVSSCTFGDVVTPVLGENSVNLTGGQILVQNSSFTNPIRFPFDFTWPGTFTLIVEAWHDTNQSNSRSHGVLISRLPIQRVLDVSDEWTEDKHELTHSSIQFDFRVTCDAHYYGSGCAILCRPRDDSFGHYSCSASGERVCLTGWSGDYCTKPRCSAGCDEHHGHCSQPNECICQTGWKGQFCNECELYPGCVHGTCKQPWECHCMEGWGGLFCNQDLNYCTNHSPCQNNGTCFNTGQGLYTCKCPLGFTGKDCEIQMSDCEKSPCMNNGSCLEINQSYRCDCKKGWNGKHCEQKTMTCNDKPCIHGKCHDTSSGFKCECQNGYSGVICEIQVDDCNPNPCANSGKCQNDGSRGFRCKCQVGYSGERCDQNIDDCKENPCQNGGSCVDMVNKFRCVCVPGYTGTLCSHVVDLCLTKPCANGGTCKSLSNDYECNCRPGFSGKDCSNDIDECVSLPCKNGGTCVNRVNHFKCVCSDGFSGIQCDDEAYSATFDARQFESAQTARNDGLTGGQVVLIAILSVAMPVVAVIAACVVICMKRKRKRAQEKDDAEARKQNEQNASANLHHGNSMSSSKRSSSGGLTFDNSNPTIIKNTWDKSVNNISSSASVDERLMNTSIYGAISTCTDNNANGDCFGSVPPLQRAKSQKQLNTDPSVMHRASQIVVPPTKEYLFDSKRISVLGDAAFCNPRWPTPASAVTAATASQRPMCSPPHM